MATMLQAYRRYAPQIQGGPAADHEQISAYISQGTGLDKHEIRMVLGKLRDATLHFARQGRGVKFEGLLRLWPTINSKGKLSLGRRFDNPLTQELNDLKLFGARIDNFEHRTWTEQDYRDAWNAEFPQDPITD